MQSESTAVGLSRKKFWLFLAAGVVVYLLMRYISGNLDSKAIIKFELAKTVESAQSLMNSWGADGIRYLRNSIYADFLFIVAYSGTFFYGCRFFGEVSGNDLLQKSGRVFSFLGLIAGISDVLENIGMLVTLQPTMLGWVVHLTYDMALVKFSLIFIILLFWVICWLFAAIDQLANRSRKLF